MYAYNNEKAEHCFCFLPHKIGNPHVGTELGTELFKHYRFIYFFWSQTQFHLKNSPVVLR